ncbi:delta(14)-sterol reductase [Cephus cinctus]|uniref:Delta(14)-sterol reductase n=1 Tax=Cephus cinctus TaxID=211228 RepID=A0AAJ7FVJ3_CEPCN|nr:delta(14)-sterol reductase [Cephus cinctus]XP_024947861.1 delta(14)-sterol reductase [Cephus cinctus]
MRFSEGDAVLAKPPNTLEYLRGKVLNVKGDKYKIKFPGGEQFLVHESDIKAERTSRSTTRSRGKVTRKSPSRNSPSRKSPSRRSPARSPNTRARRLPLRSTRLSKISAAQTETSSAYSNDGIEKDIAKKRDIDEDSPTELISLQTRLRETGPVTRRSIRTMSSAINLEYNHKLIVLTKKIDRAASLPVEKKSQLYEYIPKERGFSVQRDQDIAKILHYEEDTFSDTPDVVEKPKKEMDLVSKPQEWGGWIGALCCIFALPASVILPQIACQYGRCSFTQYSQVPTNWKSYLNVPAFLLYSGFLFFVSFVSSLPIGKLVDGQHSKIGILQYHINGIIAAILSLSLLGISEYNDYGISEFILQNSLQLSISGWILGAFLALVLYIKGGRASVAVLNMYASTDNVIYDFWQGREINPRFGPLDFKMILCRTGVIGALIINSIMIVKSIEESGSSSWSKMNVALLLAASLQIFYSLDTLLFESSLLTSFEFLYEGTGYMLCVGHLLYPFLSTLSTRYLLHHKIEQLEYLLAVPVLCFLIGYILYRLSNSQKNGFRKNPLSPALSHLETIPTPRGKKLIMSGLWGFVRHPNYLGDVIMQWSMASMCLTSHFLAYYPAICCTLTLMYRAIRDNARCKRRYGTAWDEYCSRVRFMILKRVF